MREIKRIIRMSDGHMRSIEETVGTIVLSGYTLNNTAYDEYGYPTYLEFYLKSDDGSAHWKYEVYPEKNRIVYYDYRLIEDGSWVLLSSCAYDFNWRNIIRFAV